MREYLIRTAEYEWPGVHHDRLLDVVIPAGFDCKPVEGFGDVRLRCGRVEVSFSGEAPGWLVVFEGDLEDLDTEAFVDVVTEQIAREVGEPCESLRLT